METYFDNIKQKLLVESAIPDLCMIINEEEKPSVLGTAGKAAGIGAGLAGLGSLGYTAATAAEGSDVLAGSWELFKKIINPLEWGKKISEWAGEIAKNPEVGNFLTSAKEFISNPATIGVGLAGAVVAGLYLLKKKEYNKQKELDIKTLERARALAQLPPQQAQRILQQIKR